MGKHEKTKEEIKSSNQKSKKTAVKGKKKKHVALKVFLVVLIILGIAGGLFVKRVQDLHGNWLAALLGHNEETVKNLDKLYVLAMGESTGMSDTIIVCSYDPKTQEASMLSIPRDTFVGDSKSHASVYDKINSLYNNGQNPENTLEAVNKITGLDIKNYVLIDTKGLVKLVDEIGGIEFDVPINMKYDDETQDLHINFQKGLQKLNGEQVEELVRFRHNNDGTSYSYDYGNEDFGRMRTQREVIITVAKQMIQLKNITEIGKIIDIAREYVKTNMNFDDLKDYIPYMINMSAENIQAERLPGDSDYLNGLSFFLYDEEETESLVDKLFRGIPEEVPEEQIDANNVINSVNTL